VTLGDEATDTVKVVGKLQVTSGTPGAGKVLVSDALGNATWTALTVPGQPATVLRVGTGAEFGTIQAALNSILDNSASKPYIIQVAPGRYEEGPIFLKPYVSLEGGGCENTVLAMPEGSAQSRTLWVNAPQDGGTGDRVIRDLTIEHSIAGASIAIALFAENCPSLRLQGVRLVAEEGATCSFGLQVWTSSVTVEGVRIDVSGVSERRGVSLQEAALEGRGLDVQVTGNQDRAAVGTGDGIHVVHSDLNLNDSSVTVTNGVTDRGIACAMGVVGEPREIVVQSSRVSAGTAAWEQSDATNEDLQSLVFHSVLAGPVVASVGDFQCVGSEDGDGNRLRTANVSSAVVTQKEDNLEAVLTVGAGGEYATIAEAMAAIVDNSEEHPYVVKVGPGVFAEKVTMKPYVSLVGSGIGITRIQPPLSGALIYGIQMASYSALSDVTVEGTTSGATGYMVKFSQVGDTSLERVRVQVSGTSSFTGLYLYRAQVVCRDVTVVNETSSQAVFLYMAANEAPIEFTATDCSFTGTTSLNVNWEYCTVTLLRTALNGAVTNNYGVVTMRQCELTGGFVNYRDAQVLAENCTFVNSSLTNGYSGLSADAPQFEMRHCRYSGTISNRSTANLLVALSQLNVLGGVTDLNSSTSTFFQCYDNSYQPVSY
jgi:pectin methylesterase-like acyl-CoA thioesterase